MGQNALGQADYRIFKSNRSLEQTDEIAWFFACWYKFTKIKSWVKNFGVQKGLWLLWSKDLKLAVSQDIDGIIWFFEGWYKFRIAKSYDDNYWVGVVENGCDLLSNGNLKFGVSQFHDCQKLL